jgi:hypothetical protein
MHTFFKRANNVYVNPIVTLARELALLIAPGELMGATLATAAL